jgi:hypothetical protein
MVLELEYKIKQTYQNEFKKMFLTLFAALLLVLLFLRVLHWHDIKKINLIIAKVETRILNPNDLVSVFGTPDVDEIQSEKRYNTSNNKSFNCKPPFRYIRYERSFLIIFEFKFEDNLNFYFEENGNFCFFERYGL